MWTPDNKSHLSAGADTLSPRGSRSPTPKPGQGKEGEEERTKAGLGSQRGGDHFVGLRHRLSLRNYPRDCPPLQVQWYFAVDVPKRKPTFGGFESRNPTNVPVPKKWNRFSHGDSQAIEAAFQKISEEAAASERRRLSGISSPGTDAWPQFRRNNDGDLAEGVEGRKNIKVPVNEDYLFDVDIENRELGPAYWLGPIYEVRRGTWFYLDGSKHHPCDENLAAQLEEGYLKLKPWRFAQQEQQRSTSQNRSRPTSLRAGAGEELAKALREPKSNPITPKSSSDNLKRQATLDVSDQAGQEKDGSSPSATQMRTHRLFGAHMNSVVTYQDSRTAYILTDTFLSQLSGSVYQRIAGGAYLAGTKVVRGYEDKSRDPKGSTKSGLAGLASDNEDSDGDPEEGSKRAGVNAEGPALSPRDTSKPHSERRRQNLERQMSSLVASSDPQDLAKQEEEVRKREEKEIRNDYKEREGEEQGREIEHLLLVTHGIGQRLGLRMESINFVHDVNTMRKTMKTVYANSPDLQALNGEVDRVTKNCRVQVLPICWRHLLDFPKQSLKHNRQEYDLGDLGNDDDAYPCLEDISVDGVPAVRNLITDLALDVLLFQSPAYKDHISRIVVDECNRIYRLFLQRNPGFKGKVSFVGHSLGSAIMFDLLCRQPEEGARWTRHMQRQQHRRKRSADESLRFEFEVEDFYALGSPIGLFQMLKGRTIAARKFVNFVPPDTPKESIEDPFLLSSGSIGQGPVKLDITTSSPKCSQVFNIFHPTDPVGYRIEPLISPAMASLKPQPLPYTKKGIFGAPVGQGLTGIGARVGQSVSGFWSSFSSGIASSLLNHSLGVLDDPNKQSNTARQQSRAPLSLGPSATSSSSTQNPPDLALEDGRKPRRLTTGSPPETIVAMGDDGEHPATLIDSEIETLYAGFQKRRKSQASDDGRGSGASAASAGAGREEAEEWAELEEKSRRLKREEEKVRALNANGRVDYAIQEGAFDISLIASIASHLSYWADEDVSHFMVSQLLARHRVIKRDAGGLHTVVDEDQTRQKQQKQQQRFSDDDGGDLGSGWRGP